MTPTPTRISDAAARASGLSEAELTTLLDLARRASLAGAEPLRRLFRQEVRINIKGAAGNLVTEADHAAEAAVLDLLAVETPDVGVLAEESGRRGGSGDLLWCVDPLDGTTNYAHGFPFFGTSVGLTWQGMPLLGAFAMPALDQLFWAAPGLGAWCNGQPMAVSPCASVAEALLATGFAYDRITRLDNNYAEFAWFTHRSHGVRRAGAAAADLAYVAAGRLDGYWERGLAPWDLAAGVVLVEQAGGVVSGYDGGPLDLASGRIVASGPALHGEILGGLAQCRPLTGASFGAPDLDAIAP
jgi:myo-inositol-1(or 4)-monophosphatase